MASIGVATDKLQARPATDVSRRLRSAIAVLLAGVGCIAVIAYIPTHWVESNILDTDAWIQTVSAIPKDPTVSAALGSYMVDRLFTGVDVQSKVAAALPEKAAFLAGPITDQVTRVANQASAKLVASDQFQGIWISVNRVAHARLVDAARSNQPTSPRLRNKEAQIQLNLQPVKQLLHDRLGVSGSTLIDPNERKINLQVAVDARLKLERLRNVVGTLDKANQLLPLLAIASLLGAIALARQRRLTIMVVATTIIIATLLQLIGVKALRPDILNLAQQESYRPAIGIIYDDFVISFKQELWVGLGVSIAILIVALCAGGYSWAITLRQTLRLNRLHSERLVHWRRAYSKFATENAWYIWLGSLIVVLMILSFALSVSWLVITQVLLIWASLLAIAELVRQDQSA